MLAYLTKWLNRAANGYTTGRDSPYNAPRRGPEMDPARARATYNPGG
jgi:hypothetical protein